MVNMEIRHLQGDNMANVKKRIEAICDHLNIKNIQELAVFLDVGVSAIYSWQKREKIGNTGAILAKAPRINLRWLETGEGPMLKYEPPPGNDIKFSLGQSPMGLSPKIAARIEPGNSLGNHHQKATTPGELIAKNKADDVLSDDEIDNMVQMTKKVLKSDTIHRSALASNIRAFHYAVEKEEEVKTTNEKIESLMVEMAADRAEMKEMKELLRQLVGEPKREAAN